MNSKVKVLLNKMIRIKLKGKNGNEEFINMEESALSLPPSTTDHENNGEPKNVKIVLKDGNKILKETNLNQVSGFRILFNDDKLGDVIDIKQTTTNNNQNNDESTIEQLNSRIQFLENQLKANAASYNQQISLLEKISQLQEQLDCANQELKIEKLRKEELEQKVEQQEVVLSRLKNEIESSSSFPELSAHTTSPELNTPSNSSLFEVTAIKSASTPEIEQSPSMKQKEVTINIPANNNDEKDEFPSYQHPKSSRSESKSPKVLSTVHQTTPNRKSSDQGLNENRRTSFWDFFLGGDDNSVSSLKRQLKEYKKSNNSQAVKIQELEELVHKLKRQNRHQQKYIKKLEDPDSVSEVKNEEEKTEVSDHRNTSVIMGPWFVPTYYTSSFYTPSSHMSHRTEPASLPDQMRRQSLHPRMIKSPPPQ